MFFFSRDVFKFSTPSFLSLPPQNFFYAHKPPRRPTLKVPPGWLGPAEFSTWLFFELLLRAVAAIADATARRAGWRFIGAWEACEKNS
jgi:hypothetical protein